MVSEEKRSLVIFIACGMSERLRMTCLEPRRSPKKQGLGGFPSTTSLQLVHRNWGCVVGSGTLGENSPEDAAGSSSPGRDGAFVRTLNEVERAGVS